MQEKSSTSVRIFYPRFDREELIQKLKGKMTDLAKELPLLWVVLFGSYAQGNYTVASDIDILVVYKGQERDNAFAAVKKTLDIPLLEPHVYSEEQYQRLKEVIQPMITGGVVLFSQEECGSPEQAPGLTSIS